MCLQKRYSIVDLEDEESTTAMTSPRKKQHTRVRSERKRCSSEVNLSDPRLVGVRPNSMGAALRDKHAYYITEFDLGYSMLVFPSSRSLNHSEPKSIVTLPYPFHGTDNTVFNGTAYYNYGDMLIAYNVKTGDTKELRLNISSVAMQICSGGRSNCIGWSCLDYAVQQFKFTDGYTGGRARYMGAVPPKRRGLFDSKSDSAYQFEGGLIVLSLDVAWYRAD
ncbi:hypothetical protein ANCDUO_08010 [Ancylostoma duodenale]|uniref:Olfactomedin-like domain-containing protein n=1 Tax=Ancylostoma duodenale TaxID=51022 RepID=A0A0C2GKF4_9BILA|nr:hypothetical protein ANCDUO_08010 [Ancylostoma duodenale]